MDRDDAHVTRWVARPAAQDTGLLSTLKTLARVALVMGATATSLVLALLIRIFVCPLDPIVGRAWIDRYVVGAWADGVIGGPILPRSTALKLSGELPRPDHRAEAARMHDASVFPRRASSGSLLPIGGFGPRWISEFRGARPD